MNMVTLPSSLSIIGDIHIIQQQGFQSGIFLAAERKNGCAVKLVHHRAGRAKSRL
jgi:hypothetical protein